MEGQGRSQGGYRADGQTAGSDLVDRNREASPVEGNGVDAAFFQPCYLSHKHTHRKQRRILGDTNNSWHKEILRCTVSIFSDAESWGWPPLFPCPTFFSVPLCLAHNYRHTRSLQYSLLLAERTHNLLALLHFFFSLEWASQPEVSVARVTEVWSIVSTGMFFLWVFQSPVVWNGKPLLPPIVLLYEGLNWVLKSIQSN